MLRRQAVLAAALAAAAAWSTIPAAHADVIPYPNVGTVNAASYSFVAGSSGDVIAYFAGSTASYDNQLGLLVNGVSTGIIGLDNHTSALGQSLDLGHANVGDMLTFVLDNLSLGQLAYSDPTLNSTYDDPTYTGSHQHIYSTAYTATSPVIGSIPAGVYVGFEDIPFPKSDFNYIDEAFVFTTGSASLVATPEPASIGLFGIGLCGALGLRRRLTPA